MRTEEWFWGLGRVLGINQKEWAEGEEGGGVCWATAVRSSGSTGTADSAVEATRQWEVEGCPWQAGIPGSFPVTSESSGFTQYPQDWVWNYKPMRAQQEANMKPSCGDTSEPHRLAGMGILPSEDRASHKEVNPQEEGPAASSAQRSTAQELRIIG